MSVRLSEWSRWLPALVGCFVVLPTVAGAQGSAVDSLRAAFEAMNYDEAEALGQRILSQAETRSPDELAATHALLGIIAYNQNRLQAARAHFLSLLSLSPNYKLDPLYASPKVRQFFRQIKKENQAKPPPKATLVRYIRVTDPRPGAAWRSLLLPGWGHLYRGERRLGYGVLGTTVTLGAVTIAVAMKERDAREKYLDARTEAEIASRYDTYNRYYRLRRGCVYSLGVLWLLAYVDASFRPVKHVKLTGTTSPVTVGVTVAFP